MKRVREKRLKNVIARACAVAVLCAGTALAADPGITVSAKPRYPWNGLVDLRFTIIGEAGKTYDTSFTAKDMVGNTNIAMRTIRKVDGTAAAAKEQLLPGTYSWVWDTVADLPKGFKCNRVRVAGTALDEFPYSVKFNANGGTGTMANESFTYGTAKALTANAFTRTDYTFQGWATSASGAKVYNDKQSVSNLTQTSGAVVNLYAVWKVARGKVQLWAGGPYWADRNIGATTPEDYGYYFWWGDTVGYKRQNNKWVASDGSSSNFSFSSSNTPTYGKVFSTLKSGGWITQGLVLVAAHDAAHAHWGGKWRMPTKAELVSMKDNCKWTQTTMNGVNGYVVSGKGDYANNSIFLPAAGYGNGTSLNSAGSTGYYWSSVPLPGGNYSDYEDKSACRLVGAGVASNGYNIYRYYGQSVRPVCSQ